MFNEAGVDIWVIKIENLSREALAQPFSDNVTKLVRTLSLGDVLFKDNSFIQEHMAYSLTIKIAVNSKVF